MSRGPFLYVRTNASSFLNATTAAAHPKVETLESSVGKDMRVAIRRAERIVCSLAWASSCDTRRSSFLGYLFCLGRAPLRCLTFQCVSCLRCQRWRPSWCGVCVHPPIVQPSLALSRRRRPDATSDPLPAPLRQYRRAPPHSRQRRRGHSAAVAAAALQTRPPRPPPGRHRRPVFPTPPPLGRHRHQSVATDPPPLSRRRHHCLAAAAATQPLPPPQPFSRRPRGR